MPEKNNHHKIAVIGAGPAGMAAAFELSKKSEDFIVLEKGSQVGGLAKTYLITEKEGSTDMVFRTDNGPHRFFSKNLYLYNFFKELLDERWLMVKRHTQQYINGKYFDYPVNLRQIIGNLGFAELFLIMADFIVAVITYRIFRRPVKNFYDFAVSRFGRTLAEMNMLGYTEKIWGISTKNLHPDWAHQRITGLSIWQLFKSALPKKVTGEVPKTLQGSFFYPELGSGYAYEMARTKIENLGYKILLNSYPTEIYHSNGKITGMTARLNTGDDKKIDLDYMIESVHITEFINLLRPLPPQTVLEAAKKLKYRSQIYLFITLNKESVTKNQWIYYPDRLIPFARISEMKNFSDKMSPAGKTSLFVEFFCNEGDGLYNKTGHELFETAMPYFDKFGLFSRKDVRNYYIFRGGKDYPVYDLNYEFNLNILKDYLNGFKNLFYIGRPGRFRYTNQDHSLEMGILAAKAIMLGKEPPNMDDIASGKEYFEGKPLPVKS